MVFTNKQNHSIGRKLLVFWGNLSSIPPIDITMINIYVLMSSCLRVSLLALLAQFAKWSMYFFKHHLTSKSQSCLTCKTKEVKDLITVFTLMVILLVGDTGFQGLFCSRTHDIIQKNRTGVLIGITFHVCSTYIQEKKFNDCANNVVCQNVWFLASVVACCML